LHDDAHARAAVIVHAVPALAAGQAADLEHERRFFVGVKDDLRIGRVARVLVAEPTADTHDARRHGGLAQEPAGDVHLVDALIT
jgi:hypothetical protein